MSRAAILTESEVVRSLRREIEYLRSQLEGKPERLETRPPQEISEILKKHAELGRGLLLSRGEYITPAEILGLSILANVQGAASEHDEAVRAAERERCAKVVEACGGAELDPLFLATDHAAAIRALSPGSGT